ncbi:MAG: sialate O-acetylesterase [Candidatus Aminicenantes bacterium]|nr:sialate O-acetylesterase [Candidatus Aminicenantes bacterium]
MGGISGLNLDQETQSKYSPYYYQRKSLFERLPNAENEIIFLGDSITDGCNWAELLENPCIKNRGISGDVTDGVLERLGEILESRPAQVFLMIGINDLARGRTADYILNNIKRIYKAVKDQSPETELFIQSVLPVNPDFTLFPDHVNRSHEVVEINQGLIKICAHYELEFIDIYSHLTDKEDKLASDYTNDGLHLTGAGYIVWGDVLKKYLKDTSSIP